MRFFDDDDMDFADALRARAASATAWPRWARRCRRSRGIDDGDAGLVARHVRRTRATSARPRPTRAAASRSPSQRMERGAAFGQLPVRRARGGHRRPPCARAADALWEEHRDSWDLAVEHWPSPVHARSSCPTTAATLPGCWFTSPVADGGPAPARGPGPGPRHPDLRRLHDRPGRRAGTRSPRAGVRRSGPGRGAAPTAAGRSTTPGPSVIADALAMVAATTRGRPGPGSAWSASAQARCSPPPARRPAAQRHRRRPRSARARPARSSTWARTPPRRSRPRPTTAPVALLAWTHDPARPATTTSRRGGRSALARTPTRRATELGAIDVPDPGR